MNKILITIALVFCCNFTSFATDKEKSTPAKSQTNSPSDKGIFSVKTDHNLIQNPGFENKTSKWALGKYNGASGLFYTDTINSIEGNRSAFVNTENAGKQYDDVQLFTFFNLLKNAQYSVTFRAKVKSACAISISISNGFEVFYEAKFKLLPGKEFYGPFIFSSKQDDSFSFFSFNLGKTNTEMLLDEVKIQADHTNREFENVVSKSGINIHYNKDQNEICINSPTEAEKDLPIILYDANKNVIKTNTLLKGSREANITLSSQLELGLYELKVYTSNKYELFSLVVE